MNNAPGAPAHLFSIFRKQFGFRQRKVIEVRIDVMKSVKSTTALLGVLLTMTPVGYGQSRNNRGVQLVDQGGFINNVTAKYRASNVVPIDMSNSSRLESLIRAGNLYLSLNDAIALALENNIGLQIQRYQFDITDWAYRGSLAGANGAFDPTFTVNQFNYNKSQQPVTNQIGAGVNPTTITEAYNRNFGLQQTFKTGANATLGFNTSRSLTNNTNTNFIPNLNGNLSLNITQPLLRGFGAGLNTINIRVADNNRRNADNTFRTQINTVVNQVVQAYWNLVSASLNVGVARQALDLSQRLLDQNKKQVEIGTMAPIDIKQTEVQVANGEQQLIAAEAQVQTQEVTLKNLISRNGIGSSSLASVRIIPTNRVEVPTVEPVQPIQDLIDSALRNRPEVAQARVNLENTGLNLRTTKNSLLPQLNLTGQVSNPAAGGVVNPLPNIDARGVETPRLFNPSRVGGFSNTLNQLFLQQTVNYQLGFTLNISLRNRSAQAAYAQAELNQRTQELQLQQQMNTIRADVQNAQIQIARARAQYAAAEKALAAQEVVVDAEERKFQLGASTLFVVIQQQNTLATTRQNMVTAQVAYANAKLALDVATGNLMEQYNIVFDEARDGAVTRRADPIPDVVNQPNQAAR
jgi:outer membrane protein